MESEKTHREKLQMNLTTETLTGMDWTTRTVDTNDGGVHVYQFFVDYDAAKAFYRYAAAKVSNSVEWRTMVYSDGETADSIADTACGALQAAYDSIKK